MVKKQTKCLEWINTSVASYVQFLRNCCDFAFFPHFLSAMSVNLASFSHFCKGTEILFLSQNHFNLLATSLTIVLCLFKNEETKLK